MKKTLLWMIAIGLMLGLAACALPGGPAAPADGAAVTPTLSDAEMSTQISAMLTAMPTATTEPKALPSPTQPLPTVEITATVAEEPTAEPVATELPPTATKEPEAQTTAEATPTPAATVEAGGEAPTATAAPSLTPTSGAQPTLSASDPRATLGNPALTDVMEDPRPWLWPTGPDKYTYANWENGSLSLTALTELLGWRLSNPRGTKFRDFYLEMTVKSLECSGSDQYGFMFRVPELNEANKGYMAGISCDGRFSLRTWDGTVGTKGEMKSLISWQANSAIKSGSNVENRLGVWAVGDKLAIYVNGVKLGEVNNNLYPEGNFGIFIGSPQKDAFTIEVQEVSLWENVK